MEIRASRFSGGDVALVAAFGVLVAAFAAFLVVVQAWLTTDARLADEHRQRASRHAAATQALERGLAEATASYRRYLREPTEAHRAQHDEQVDLWRRAWSALAAESHGDDVLRRMADARAGADSFFGELEHAMRSPGAAAPITAAGALRANAVDLLREAGDAQREAALRDLREMEATRGRMARSAQACGAFVIFALLLIGLLARSQARRLEREQRQEEKALGEMLARAEQGNRDLRDELSVARRDLEASRAAGTRKDEFFGILGHELRNPLAPLANAHLLLGQVEPSSPGYARAREIMARQIRHLTRLVDDLLDATRIANGKVTLHRTRLDLAQLVRESLHDHGAAAEAHAIQLVASLQEAPVMVDGDPARLRQVLDNLVGNAIKFTPAEGWIIVTLETARDGSAELRVADTGAGIDTELMPRLFEPFAQGASHPDRPNTGLGLGLPLAKALVDLHGGCLQARSDGPRLGAEFVVRLPAATAPADRVVPGPSIARPRLVAGGRTEEPEARYFDAAPRTATKT